MNFCSHIEPLPCLHWVYWEEVRFVNKPSPTIIQNSTVFVTTACQIFLKLQGSQNHVVKWVGLDTNSKWFRPNFAAQLGS